jgi:hypothetical protein
LKAKDQPILSWIADVHHTAFHLGEIDVKVSDEDLILIHMQGLPPSYKKFVVTLDATDTGQLTSEHVIT